MASIKTPKRGRAVCTTWISRNNVCAKLNVRLAQEIVQCVVWLTNQTNLVVVPLEGSLWDSSELHQSLSWTRNPCAEIAKV